jgi:hypothetical protein
MPEKRKVSQETIDKRKATIKAKATKKEAKKTLNKGLKETTIFKDKKDILKTSLKLLDKFGKDKAKIKVETLPIKYKKNNVFSIYFNNDKKPFTYKQLQSLGHELSNDLKKRGLNGIIGISPKFNFGWLPSVFRGFGNFHLYNPTESNFDYDQNEFNEFELYLVETPKAKGGKSTNNNCLYHCLKDVFFDNVAWADGLQLKKYLKLKFDDKVPISMIPLIEAKQNCRINITGDYVYTSTKESNKEVNLKLINEHFTLDFSKVKAKVDKYRISSTSKSPIIYDSLSKMAYNGKTLYKMSSSEHSDHMNHKTDYIIVSKSDDKFNKTFEEDYKEFIRDADILLEKSNGLINMYKTGNDKITALNLFDWMTKHINPDNIQQAEADWVSKSSIGALITAEPYEGKAYEYDIKSQYPSIQKSGMLYPVKSGEFLKLETLPDDFYKYGIYRATITKSDDININRLFRFNNDNYYTHFDLTTAKFLQLEINLIIDDQPNFLHYSRDKCLTGNEIFGPYINLLFELKQLKLTDRTKSILNILWGALCEKKLVKNTVSLDDDEYDIPELNELVSIVRTKDNSYYFKHQDTRKQYKSPFARICPFIVSKGRANISKILEPYKEDVVKIHTDGFILNKEPIGIKLSDSLGGLVLEGIYNHIKIINNSKPIIIN